MFNVSVCSECVVEQVRERSSIRKVTVNASGAEEKVSSKLSMWQTCTVLVTVHQLVSAAAAQPQEKFHLLFHCLHLRVLSAAKLNRYMV